MVLCALSMSSRCGVCLCSGCDLQLPAGQGWRADIRRGSGDLRHQEEWRWLVGRCHGRPHRALSRQLRRTLHLTIWPGKRAPVEYLRGQWAMTSPPPPWRDAKLLFFSFAVEAAWNLVNWFSVQYFCHHMSHFKAKFHKIWLGLRCKRRWGERVALPRSLADLRGLLSGRRGDWREWDERKEELSTPFLQ